MFNHFGRILTCDGRAYRRTHKHYTAPTFPHRKKPWLSLSWTYMTAVSDHCPSYPMLWVSARRLVANSKHMFDAAYRENNCNVFSYRRKCFWYSQHNARLNWTSSRIRSSCFITKPPLTSSFARLVVFRWWFSFRPSKQNVNRRIRFAHLPRAITRRRHGHRITDQFSLTRQETLHVRQQQLIRRVTVS